MKEKKKEDPKQRYYVTAETIADLDLGSDEEIEKLCKERLDVVLEEIQKQKDEQQRVKEEKKMEKQAEKLKHSPMKTPDQEVLKTPQEKNAEKFVEEKSAEKVKSVAPDSH